MKTLLFIGSHLGYPMEKTPLGGGAMVGLQLARRWAKDAGDFRFIAVGSGPQAPEGANYVQLPQASGDPGLTGLSELAYAAFCRKFEHATTEFVLAGGFDPETTAIVVNDISESPDLDALVSAGYAIASIWHVDVVDFFNRLYLGSWLAPERWTRGYERLENLGLGGLVPDVLRLIFQKQRQAVRRARLLVLPSRRMEETVARCYGAARTMILPWGGWDEAVDEAAVARRASELRKQYALTPETCVVMTLSRISPEKGLHYVLDALAELESSEQGKKMDVAAMICGEPAFMRGREAFERLKKSAKALKRFRVVFPGYLGPEEKAAHFKIADLFVSASIHESYGLTIVEALRAGLPVAAADHYGSEEVLRPEYARRVSFAASSQRARNLAEGLAGLLSDRTRLQSMGVAARAAGRAMSFDASAAQLKDAALALAGGSREIPT